MKHLITLRTAKNDLKRPDFFEVRRAG